MTGFKSGCPGLFQPTDLPARGARVGRGAARGRFWGRFAAFWRVLGDFFAFLAKSQKPPPPGIEPTTAPIFGRGHDRYTGSPVVLSGNGPRATASPVRRSFAPAVSEKAGEWGVSAEKSGLRGNWAPPGARCGESESPPCHSAGTTRLIPGTSAGLPPQPDANFSLTLPCIS